MSLTKEGKVVSVVMTVKAKGGQAGTSRTSWIRGDLAGSGVHTKMTRRGQAGEWGEGGSEALRDTEKGKEQNQGGSVQWC